MGLKFLATKGLGLLGKSKTKTIDAVEPTLGQKKTRKFKIGAGINRLNKLSDDLIQKRNEDSKKILKSTKGK